MRFSVIIPVYNKAPFVAKAIQSVIAQTFTDYELVVMDDGSVDESCDVARKALEGCPHAQLYQQKNAGVSAARNNAVAFSKGEYLCFLDADDWWEPTFLEEMDGLIRAFPEAGIYGTNYTIVNETKRKTRVANVGVDAGFENGYINYCPVYAKTLAMPLWTGATCVPRRVFEEMGGFPLGIKLGEDFLLWIHIALKYKVAFLNKPLSYYNQDVDAANRGVGHLNKPEDHMLWNLMDLEPLEQTNHDYKQLVDNLRVYDLYPYFLSRDYHAIAAKELEKVDWERQPRDTKKRYQRPLAIQRFNHALRKLGSRLKTKLYSRYDS